MVFKIVKRKTVEDTSEDFTSKPHQSSKTFICSVVFIDIIEYSKRPVDEQIRLKEKFNDILVDAVKDIALNDRIIIDTGDGAGIGLLGDPEEALFISMSIRDAINTAECRNMMLQVRTGINLGPVRFIKDVNNRPNLIGDGINVAQRVMGFSRPGEIFVSRSYYEMVSRLSTEYAHLFHYEGSHADKHIREHEVYAVGKMDNLNVPLAPTPKPQTMVALPGQDLINNRPEALSPSKEPKNPEPVLSPLINTSQIAKQKGSKKILLISSGTLFLTIILGIVLYLSLSGGKNTDSASLVSEEGPLKEEEQMAPQAPATTPEEQVIAQAPAVTPEEQAPPQAPAVTPVEPIVQKKATVNLGISPWGEIYVNGEKKGVSPPLKNLKLPPGTYKIEVKNTTFKPFVETIKLDKNEKRKLTHKFE